MEINLTKGYSLIRKRLLMIIMRTFIFLCCATIFAIAPNDLVSQNSKIKIAADELLTVDEVFDLIMEQTEYKFFYEEGIFNDFPKVQVQKGRIRTNMLLKQSLEKGNLNIEVTTNNVILISIKPQNGILEGQQNKELQVNISGTITDENNQPLPGANIVEKGTTNGTQTDFDGNFSLELENDNATLVISYIGFTTKEIPVNGQTTLNIVLEESSASLDEVVVIGYGTQKQRDVTGSIATIKMDVLENQPVGQVTQKLQGQLAGVQIDQSSGVPGQGLGIRIRGAASINAGNNPLYVIDGFPIDGDIGMMNPDEIENISVLKGSSASSLYGSRAANGVVLVTTKKATVEGETIVRVNVTTGVSKVPQKGRLDLMNSKEFLAHSKAFWEDKIRYEGYTGGVPELYQNPEAWTGPDTDWFDVLLQTAFRESYSISLLSKKGKFSSANTVGYYKEDGVVINSGYQRVSLRSNNEYEVNDNLRVGFNVAPTYQINNNLNAVGLESDFRGQYNMVYAASVTPPIFSPDDTNPDGSPVLSFSGPGLFTFPNWKKTAEEQTNKSKEMRILSSIYAEVDFLENFKFRSSASIDYNSGTNRTFFPSNISAFIFSPPPPNQASGSYGTSNSILWLAENNLSFTKTFADNHNIDAIVGFSAQAYRMENAGFSGNQFPDDLVPWLDAAANVTSWNNGLTEWSLMSMYGRLNYDYKNKYLLSVSLRRDGSSRFGSENQWGSFPSISAGWVISDEFAEGIPGVNFLKLRGEYGITGNFNIGNYSQFGNIVPANYVFNNSLAAGRSQNTIGNNNLTWETTSGMGIGVDIEAFKGRIALTYDYYDKTTDDMLYQIDIPWGTGFSNIQDNIGEFKFWGHEFSLNTKNTVGTFKWNTDFNITFNRNKVIKLGTNNEPIGANSFWVGDSNRTAVGHPIGSFYGFVADGVYMNQAEFDRDPKNSESRVGTGRYKDLNGDGVIDGDDRTFIGNPNPDFVYGLTNSFSFKNFDLNVVITGAQGGDKARTILEWSEILEGNFNVEKYVIDRWRSPENPGAGIIGRTLSGATVFSSGTVNTRWVEDASYLSINNITLGYTLPNIKNIGKARIYLSAQNALLLTNYSGANPQASRVGLNALRQGIDDTAYPLARTFALGLDFKF